MHSALMREPRGWSPNPPITGIACGRLAGRPVVDRALVPRSTDYTRLEVGNLFRETLESGARSDTEACSREREVITSFSQVR